MKYLNCIFLTLITAASFTYADTTSDAIKQDNDLNSTYSELLKQLDQKQKNEIIESQKQWIKYRDSTCSFEKKMHDDKSWISEKISSKPQLECILRLTTIRVKELKDYLKSSYRSEKRLSWTKSEFEFPNDKLSCDGAQFVHFDDQYKVYVGIVLCNNHDQIRIYMSSDSGGPYYQATDGGGHGQDQCELINPKFTISNDDDITSGGCSICETSENLPIENLDVWNRSRYGEDFKFKHSGSWSYQTTRLKCGVSFTDCLSENSKSKNCTAKDMNNIAFASDVGETSTPRIIVHNIRLVNEVTKPVEKTSVREDAAVIPVSPPEKVIQDPKKLKLEREISNKNIEIYKANLTSGQINFFKSNPDAIFKISDLKGGVSPVVNQNYVPYPQPKNGEEAIWNHLLRYRGEQMSRDAETVTFLENQDPQSLSAREEYSFSYSKTSDIYRREMRNIKNPPRYKGEVLVFHSYLVPQESIKSIWQYLPGTRRVRTAPTLAFDTMNGLGEIKTYDSDDMFSGSLEKFDWKLVGKSDIYLPKIAVHQINEASQITSPENLPEFVLQPVYVVEATLKNDQSHRYHKRAYYLDANTWEILLVEDYNEALEMVVVSMAFPEYFSDQKAVLPQAEIHYNLKNKTYMVDEYTNYQFFPAGHTPEEYFTVTTLRKVGPQR